MIWNVTYPRDFRFLIKLMKRSIKQNGDPCIFSDYWIESYLTISSNLNSLATRRLRALSAIFVQVFDKMKVESY